MDGGPSARQWWLAFEPVHAVVYFDDPCRRSMEDAGMRGFWMGYVAGRAAPLGAVSPDVVTALFYNFHPDRIRRALPDAWDRAAPAEIWSARMTGAAAALRRLVPGIERRADDALPYLRALTGRAVDAGRPLFAATRGTREPDDPVAALWLHCTCLREHRGDGHVAALREADLGGTDVLALFAAAEGLPAELLQAARGWSTDEWHAATERLAVRGLLTDTGLTATGVRVRTTVEATTDRLAAQPFASLDPHAHDELYRLLSATAWDIHAAGVIPFPNPIGLPQPVL